MDIKKKAWGEYRGKTVWLYSLSSDTIEVDITNYGCTITAIRVKGKDAIKRNVILGYSSFDELRQDKYYMGCLVGRYAGRISNASFTIDDQRFDLPANDGNSGNHLHGGPDGFNKILFDELASESPGSNASITFVGISKDLDQGYPGNLEIKFTISLDAENEVLLSYEAKPDRPTHINLTHHLYYNLCAANYLGGENNLDRKDNLVSMDNLDREDNLDRKDNLDSEDNLAGRHNICSGDTRPATDQHLSINASSIAETAANYIPTGALIPAPAYANFRNPKKIPADQDYNECFVLDKSSTSMPTMQAPIKAAVLADPLSGIEMTLFTSCPALLFYSGQFLDKPFFPKQGICLEAQYLPDAPNQPGFPSTLYSDKKKFEEVTRLHFKL